MYKNFIDIYFMFQLQELSQTENERFIQKERQLKLTIESWSNFYSLSFMIGIFSKISNIDRWMERQIDRWLQQG